MRYIQLGTTDLQVSVLALGCWPFMGGDVWGQQKLEDSLATVDAALAAGINIFDTAIGYGNGESERVLGQALRGRRQEAIIATKLGGVQTHPDQIRQTCQASLANLQTDYIDLYQIHWPCWYIPAADTVGALQELQTLGWIRHFAVCNYGPQDFTAIADLATIPSNQLPYSLLWRAIEHRIQSLCLERKVGIVCYSPLMQGLLTGRYATMDEVPAGLARTRLYDRDRVQAEHHDPGCENLVMDVLGDIRNIAADLGLSMATLSLAWVLQQPGVATVLVGARTPSELAWNLPALDTCIPADALAALDRVTQPVKDYVGTNPDMWFSQSRMR